MTTDQHAELRRLQKEVQKLNQKLRAYEKRTPGLHTIEALERIAYTVPVPEDAGFLRSLAKRLEDLRAIEYGPRKGYHRDPTL